jgi:hypothetical protein
MVLWIVVVVGALLLVGALSIGNDSDRPYDPDSVTPTGTRAFVELLESFGTDVAVPDSFDPKDAPLDETLIMFQDATSVEQTEQLEQWIRDGGTLVITEPYSTFAPVAEIGLDIDIDDPTVVVDQGVCTVGALGDVAQLAPVVEKYPQSGYWPTFPVGDDDTSCFGTETEAFAVVSPFGSGRVVALATGTVFMNGALGSSDNAALATSLFAPSPGRTVTILEPGAFGDGVPISDDAAVGSVDRIVGAALPFLLLQALVAIVVLALAQGRRLGKPVAEPQPVQIAGSELVRAMGDLLQQAGSPDAAAAVLRADLRREICLRIGLPPSTAVDIIAATVDARTGLGRDRILAVIADGPVARESDLVELARSIDSIREEILHVPTA